MASNRGKKAVLAAVVLAVLGLALVARRPSAASSSQQPAAAATAMEFGARMTPPPAPIAPGDFSANAWRQRLDEYKRAAVYPWWSRPHDDGTRYLLTWNQPVVSELPFDDRPGEETSYHFAADRMHVPYGETLTSWIEVWRKGHESERVAATVRQAWVMAVDGTPGRLLPLVFEDDGSRRYINRLVPSHHPELVKSRQVRIVAEVEAAGQTRVMVRDFTYAPREVLQVVGITDSIVSGSLAITLEVDVMEAGVYTFAANLMTGDGQVPLAWSEIGAQLAPGRQRVQVPFFGKALRDQGQAGPYLLRDVRGFLHKDDAEHNIWWSWLGSYRTAAYQPTDFSPAEWDSAEKREKLRSMQEIIDQTAQGQLGGTGASPHIHIGEDGVARQISP